MASRWLLEYECPLFQDELSPTAPAESAALALAGTPGEGEAERSHEAEGEGGNDEGGGGTGRTHETAAYERKGKGIQTGEHRTVGGI